MNPGDLVRSKTSDITRMYPFRDKPSRPCGKIEPNQLGIILELNMIDGQLVQVLVFSPSSGLTGWIPGGILKVVT